MTETWQIVSKHRAELMALSILWVISFHFITPPLQTYLILLEVSDAAVLTYFSS